MDAYSKFIQTVIAIALVCIAIRPLLSTTPVDAQSITNVRVVAFDVSAPLPVIDSGPPLRVNVVDAAAPLAVTIAGPMPLPIVTR
ncbi:MAG TPA: hypothetical protein VM620_03090 [Hyphomicrobium sp.]|nr:hypothetical protein [Hyphomicrobium sp.]